MEIFNNSKDIKIFDDTMKPEDLVQGELTPKWFICALSTLAERPKLIEKLFITKEFK